MPHGGRMGPISCDIQRTGGDNNNQCVTDGVPTCQSRNVYKGSARLRVTF